MKYVIITEKVKENFHFLALTQENNECKRKLKLNRKIQNSN